MGTVPSMGKCLYSGRVTFCFLGNRCQRIVMMDNETFDDVAFRVFCGIIGIPPSEAKANPLQFKHFDPAKRRAVYRTM